MKSLKENLLRIRLVLFLFGMGSFVIVLAWGSTVTPSMQTANEIQEALDERIPPLESEWRIRTRCIGPNAPNLNHTSLVSFNVTRALGESEGASQTCGPVSFPRNSTVSDNLPVGSNTTSLFLNETTILRSSASGQSLDNSLQNLTSRMKVNSETYADLTLQFASNLTGLYWNGTATCNLSAYPWWNFIVNVTLKFLSANGTTIATGSLSCGNGINEHWIETTRPIPGPYHRLIVSSVQNATYASSDQPTALLGETYMNKLLLTTSELGFEEAVSIWALTWLIFENNFRIALFGFIPFLVGTGLLLFIGYSTGIAFSAQALLSGSALTGLELLIIVMLFPFFFWEIAGYALTMMEGIVITRGLIKGGRIERFIAPGHLRDGELFKAMLILGLTVFILFVAALMESYLLLEL